MEAVIYLSIGIFVAFLLSASLLFAVCQCFVRTKSSRSTSGSNLGPTSQSELLNNEVAAASTPEAIGRSEGDENNSLLVVTRRRSNHSSRYAVVFSPRNIKVLAKLFYALTYSRHSFLHPSPVTEETISLDDFDMQPQHYYQHQNNSNTNRYSFPSRDRRHSSGFSNHRRSAPKLIYTQEFTDGLMMNGGTENGAEDLEAVGVDDSLAPLASFDEEANNGYVPHQFVLR